MGLQLNPRSAGEIALRAAKSLRDEIACGRMERIYCFRSSAANFICLQVSSFAQQMISFSACVPFQSAFRGRYCLRAVKSLRDEIACRRVERIYFFRSSAANFICLQASSFARQMISFFKE
jgi:hypothetical protein